MTRPTPSREASPSPRGAHLAPPQPRHDWFTATASAEERLAAPTPAAAAQHNA